MEQVALLENHQTVGLRQMFVSTEPRASKGRISRRPCDVGYLKRATSDFEAGSIKSGQSHHGPVSLYGRTRLLESDRVQSKRLSPLNSITRTAADDDYNAYEAEERSDQHRGKLRVVRANGASSQSGGGIGTRATFRLDSNVKSARGVNRGRTSYGLKSPNVVTREALGEYVEHLFTEVRGEALLIAALAYGLEVGLDELRALQIRDVRLLDGVIILGGCEYSLPIAIVEDMQEQMRRYVRSAECTPPRRAMNKLFFSSQAFSQIEAMLLALDNDYCSRLGRYSGRSEDRCMNIRLKMLGWFHRRWANRVTGVRYQSALDLFDKGPRINRRRSRGVQDMYYVWRLSRVVSW